VLAPELELELDELLLTAAQELDSVPLRLVMLQLCEALLFQSSVAVTLTVTAWLTSVIDTVVDAPVVFESVALPLVIDHA